MNGRLMQASVLVDVGRFELRDVPVHAPEPHEVMVAVKAVGLCGTDIQIVGGHANYHRDARGRVISLRDQPQILGHEIAGVVTEVGSDLHDVTPGDRVVVDQGRTCVSEARTPICEYCRTGDSHQCEHYREHGITGLPGGFAQFVTVPAVNTVRIDSALPVECAAMSEPLGCVIHAADFLSRVVARYRLTASQHQDAVRTALVCGAGPAGLLFVQYLRNVLAFDGQLLVSEPNATKRALAERFGATTINPLSDSLVEAVAERTQGRRVELLIEASGSGSIFPLIPGLIRKQATLLMYGHGHSGVELSVMNQIQFLEPSLVASTGASGAHDARGRPLTYVRALDLIEKGRIDVASFITHRYASLSQVPNAFAGDYAKPDYVKGVLTL